MAAITTISDNERLLLDIIRRNEPITRSLIHPLTPFTQPSVHRILNNLIDKQLITVGEARVSGPGKPSPEICLNRTSYYSVGILVNTDAITIYLANLACEPMSKISFEGQSHNRDYALQRIQQEVHTMLEGVGTTENNLAGICLSIAGSFTGEKNQVNASLPLKEWSLVDLGALLSRYFQAPISVENNATAGAIGESLIGVGRWADTFVRLSFNYGFGGGVIIDGKPFYGAHGNALDISAIYDDDSMPKRPALELLIQHLNACGVNIQTVAELRTQFDPNWPGVAEWIEQTLPNSTTRSGQFAPQSTRR